MEKKITIEQILEKLSKRVFWRPNSPTEYDILLVAYLEITNKKNKNA